MQKLQRLTLKKKVISNVTDNEMGRILGGYGDETADDCLFDSRLLCMTYFNTGGCSPSESCAAPICIPLSDFHLCK